MKNIALVTLVTGLAVGLAGAQPAAAQAPNPAPPAALPETAAPADLTRLPGDAPPPPLARMLRLPSNRPTGKGGPPPDTTPGPSLALALEAAQTALSTCAADDLLVGVVVLDSTGQMKLGLSSDGAMPGRILGAARKGLAALAYGVPTSVVQQKLRDHDAEATAKLTPAMVVLPGGVPLFASGRPIGAIAVSGATAQQDERCASAGAAKIEVRLK